MPTYWKGRSKLVCRCEPSCQRELFRQGPLLHQGELLHQHPSARRGELLHRRKPPRQGPSTHTTMLHTIVMFISKRPSFLLSLYAKQKKARRIPPPSIFNLQLSSHFCIYVSAFTICCTVIQGTLLSLLNPIEQIRLLYPPTFCSFLCPTFTCLASLWFAKLSDPEKQTTLKPPYIDQVKEPKKNYDCIPYFGDFDEINFIIVCTGQLLGTKAAFNGTKAAKQSAPK